MQDKSRTTPCYSSTTSIVTYPFLKAKTKKADKMTAIAITNIEPRVSCENCSDDVCADSGVWICELVKQSVAMKEIHLAMEMHKVLKQV